MVASGPSDLATVDRVLDWLLRTDERGQRNAMARRHRHHVHHLEPPVLPGRRRRRALGALHRHQRPARHPRPLLVLGGWRRASRPVGGPSAGRWRWRLPAHPGTSASRSGAGTVAPAGRGLERRRPRHLRHLRPRQPPVLAVDTLSPGRRPRPRRPSGRSARSRSPATGTAPTATRSASTSRWTAGSRSTSRTGAEARPGAGVRRGRAISRSSVTGTATASMTSAATPRPRRTFSLLLPDGSVRTRVFGAVNDTPDRRRLERRRCRRHRSLPVVDQHVLFRRRTVGRVRYRREPGRPVGQLPGYPAPARHR